MSDNASRSTGDVEAKIPTMQRLFDRPFLLLAAGMIVMVVFYTLWGIYDIYSLPHATLP